MLTFALSATVAHIVVPLIYQNIVFSQTICPINLEFHVNMLLKRVSLGSKDCTKELKLECTYFLDQTS